MAPKTVKIKIKCSDRISPAISELQIHLDRFGRFIDGIRNLFLSIEKRPSEISKLIRVETTTAIGKRATTVVTFKPTQLLLDILATCRTGKFDDVFVKSNLHNKTSKPKVS